MVMFDRTMRFSYSWFLSVWCLYGIPFKEEFAEILLSVRV